MRESNQSNQSEKNTTELYISCFESKKTGIHFFFRIGKS